MVYRLWTWLVSAALAFLLVSGGFVGAGHGVALAAGGADLVVSAVALLPESPVVGDRVTFNIAVSNAGSESAAASRLECYIGADSVHSVMLDPLSPGVTSTITFSWQSRAGEQTIRAVADAGQFVAESNESNNELLFSFSVLAPDLVVDGISWLPEVASAGDKVTFDVNLQNRGSSTAPYSAVDFYIDGSFRNRQEVQSLGAGEAVSKPFYWVVQPGVHEIKVVVDSLSQVVEGDETNNESTVSYSTLAPDLVVSAITWSPSNYDIGQQVTFTVTVKNAGQGKAFSSQVTYYLDGSFVGSGFLGPLEPAATAQGTFIWQADKDEHTVMAVADPAQEVAESAEDNNVTTISLLGLAPDLVVQNITWSADPMVEQSVTFTVTVKNQGYVASGMCRLFFYVDDYYFLGYLEGLSAGATVDKTFSWVGSAGPHTLRAVVDAEDYIGESNETNNEKTVTVSTQSAAPPDLVIQSIGWSPQNPVIGDAVTLKVTVKNQGSSAAGNSSVAGYIDDFFLTSVPVSPLGSGAAVTVDIPWTAQGGEHNIKAVADVNQIVREQNEFNNTATAKVPVKAPDLLVKDLTWKPLDPAPGDTTTLTVAVSNAGDFRAGPSLVGYYVDGSLRGNIYVEAMEPGAAVTKTFLYSAPAGPFGIRVVADMGKEVTELNEGNNERAVTIPAPDLVIDRVSWSPASPAAGEAVTFSVTVANRGAGTAPGSGINFYVDGSIQGYVGLPEMVAGMMVTEDFFWTAVSGAPVFTVVADEADEVMESDEHNNGRTAGLSVTVAPGAGETAESPLSVAGSMPEAAGQPAASPAKGAGSAASPAVALNPVGAWFKWWMVGALVLGAVVVGGVSLLLFRLRDARHQQVPEPGAAKPQAAGQ